MSDTDLWNEILAGNPEQDPEPEPPTPKKQEKDVSECVSAAAPPSLGADSEQGVEPEVAPPWVPHVMSNDEDISGWTDSMLEDCFALSPPSWLVEGAVLEPSQENISALGRAFVGKKNPVPVRKRGREWCAEKRNLTADDFKKHLAGEHLLGAYLLDDQDMTGVAVCDIDAEGDLKQRLLDGRYYGTLDLAWWGRVVGAALSVAFASGVHVTLTGGKGAHAICVLPERAPAAIVRRQLHWMCVEMGLKRSGLQWGHSSGDFFVECFPKQDTAGNGLGNLIRLPNGTEPKTGRKCLVIKDESSPVAEESAVQAMYRVDPVGQREESRRDIQKLLEDGQGLDWVESFMGESYESNFKNRCEELASSEVGQMRNAVGQAIHMAGWGQPTLAAGLISQLEIIASQ